MPNNFRQQLIEQLNPKENEIIPTLTPHSVSGYKWYGISDAKQAHAGSSALQQNQVKFKNRSKQFLFASSL